MKKLVLLLAAMSMASVAYAKEVVVAPSEGTVITTPRRMFDNVYGKFGFEKDASYDMGIGVFGSDVIAEDGYSLGIEVTRNIWRSSEFGLGLAYEDHGKVLGLGFDSIPLYFLFKHNIMINKPYTPFVKAYLGYSFNSKETSTIGDILDTPMIPMDVSMDVDNGMYYGLGAGMEVNNFTIELSYLVNKADMDLDASYDLEPKGMLKSVNRSINMDSDYERLQFSFGYKFY